MMPFSKQFTRWSAAAAFGMFVTAGGASAQQLPSGWKPYNPYPTNATGHVSQVGHKCATPPVYHPHVVPTQPGQEMMPGTEMPSTIPPSTMDPSVPPVTPPTPQDPMVPPTPSTQDPMTPPVAPPTTPDPVTPPVAQPPAAQPPAQQPLDLSFDTGLAAGGNEVAFNAAPPMQGNLLRAYRGITFQYLLSGDLAAANQSGTVNFRNTKVAENNLAIPVDRLSFRYQYFRNALDVDGLGFTGDTQSEFGVPVQAVGDAVGASQASIDNVIQSIGSSNFVATSDQPIQQVGPASKSYDVHLYTFDLEKTLFDGLASVAVRVPFADTLSSDLDLVSGQLSGSPDISTNFGAINANDIRPGINATPGQTLGFDDVEFQDIQLILKGILYQSADRRWTVSGGLGVTAPTGPDLNVRVTDFSVDDFAFNRYLGTGSDLTFAIFNPDGSAAPSQNLAILQGVFPLAIDQRVRTFDIENETWGVSPFMAFTAVPTNRWYFNGFWQLDVPVNSSSWTYTERDVDLQGVLPGASENFEQFSNSQSGEIDDQVLMHLDLGGGYWHYRDPCAKYVTGLASLLELHYTTTLNDADIINVASEPIRGDTFNADGTQRQFEQSPRIGNIGNRVDILDLSVGAHTLIGSNMLLTTGYNVPLRDGEFDRTFDGEFSVILNVFR
ncbi:hypothetical protein [Thalassoroseus pseudoceratinae]|uniref:hypothetical protein n=1 Tax=Thalassoroseus pseudoceratinae TaxID=2713176 RepID=UPI001420EEEC|nr:hypothetical protein [Thalassoroseus pseudoceratinae]